MSLESHNSTENIQEAPKSIFGVQEGGLIESERFPGTKIISFNDGSKVKRYALQRDGSGNLTGSTFELQEYSIPAGTGGDGYWKNSASSINAEGSFQVGDKEMPKYRLGPVYQMNGNELDAMEEYLESKGIAV